MRFGYVLLGLVTLTSIHISSGICDNGLAGVQKDDICCDLECGECGEDGCGGRPGGNENCCTGPIEGSGRLCSVTEEAPCIIDDEDNEGTPNKSLCRYGVTGLEANGVCCLEKCGKCGGRGCGGFPGGASGCCTRKIKKSKIFCSNTPTAPCIIDL